MMAWNCFLAFLPLVFSQCAIVNNNRQKHIWLLWALLWLIFWPNTFYMVTDVAHFTGNSFFQAIPYQSPVYSTNIQLWIKAVIIITGILYGVYNGITSEMVLENGIISKYGKTKQILFRLVCSILCGIAIYIGRFLHLNSWDVFRPAKIVTAFQCPKCGGSFILSFIGVFTAFVFTTLSFARLLNCKSENY